MEKMGLVLGGGGAKGSYQMGAWRALVQKGINNYIKIYSGASIGAINCAVIQTINIDYASKIWLNYNLEKVFISGEIKYDEILQIIKKIQKEKKIDVDGILSREGLINLFEEVHIENCIKMNEDFYICVVNVTDIPEKIRSIKPALDWYEGRKTGVTEYVNAKNMGKDDIEKYLMASSALPVIYPPVEIDGQYYVDGGVNDNLPIRPIYEKGYNKIIAISCEPVNYYNIRNQFPYADILLIQPSKYLGSMISGTLNFNKMKLQSMYKLGYMDAINALQRNRHIFG